MPDDTLLFLHTLYAPCEKGYLTLTAIHPDRKHPTPSRHIPLRDDRALHKGLIDLQQANEKGWGAFFSVATRQADLGRWRRGGQSDLSELPALFVDLDVPVAEAMKRLRAHDPPPSCIVSSGGGVHAYWFLETPTADWQRVAQALQHLRKRLGSDKSSVTQALRLVGSRNTKPTRQNAPCYLIDLQRARYPLTNFLDQTSGAIDASVRMRMTAETRLRHSFSNPPRHSSSLNPRLLSAVEDILVHHYGGFRQRNGWLGALCPCGHHRDAPGMHFAYVESKSKSRGGRLSRPYPASLPKTTLEYLTYGAPVGQRNVALFAAACQFRDAGYSLAEATSQLVSRYLADSEGHELSGTRAHEARRTIQSAYTRPPRRSQTG